MDLLSVFLELCIRICGRKVDKTFTRDDFQSDITTGELQKQLKTCCLVFVI